MDKISFRYTGEDFIILCIYHRNMVSPRSWLPIGDSGTIMEKNTADDFDRQAREQDAELSIVEDELDKLDQEFRGHIQDAAEAPETQRSRHKLKARQKKQQKEQKKAYYQDMLQEYGTLLTLKSAKERLERKNASSLRELDKSEIEDVKEDIRGQIIDENQKSERVKTLNDTVNQTLTALTDDEATKQRDDLDDLIDQVSQGEQDISEVNADFNQDSNTDTQSVSEEFDV